MRASGLRMPSGLSKPIPMTRRMTQRSQRSAGWILIVDDDPLFVVTST
jgi:hypothetical protein